MVNKKQNRPGLKGSITIANIVSLQISREKDSPVSWLMKLLIAEAINGGASELFLERLKSEIQGQGNILQVHFRLNDVLEAGRRLEHQLTDQIIARFVSYSTLDFERRWEAQSGVMKIQLGNGEVFSVEISLVKAPVGVHMLLKLPSRPDLVGKFPTESIMPKSSATL